MAIFWVSIIFGQSQITTVSDMRRPIKGQWSSHFTVTRGEIALEIVLKVILRHQQVVLLLAEMERTSWLSSRSRVAWFYHGPMHQYYGIQLIQLSMVTPS